MDALRIPALLRAVDDMAMRLDGVDSGPVFPGLCCPEVDSIARVLAIAGHGSTAALMLVRHAADEEGERERHGHIRQLLDEHKQVTAPEVTAATTAYVSALLDEGLHAEHLS